MGQSTSSLQDEQLQDIIRDGDDVGSESDSEGAPDGVGTSGSSVMRFEHQSQNSLNSLNDNQG